jgi:hypothetical protein
MTTEERFWSKVEKTGHCWIWAAARTRLGYGKFMLGSRTDGTAHLCMAHRVAWKLAGRADPGALFVLHRCDNPSCVNPDHLFLGTHEDNMADMKAKGRGVKTHPKHRGSLNHQAKLTEDDVLDIRATYAFGALQSDLAKEYGVHFGTISSIVLRDSWRHLP